MPRLLLALLLFSASLLAQAPTLMLGILEDTPGNQTTDTHVRSVRAIFYKSGLDWKPFPTDCISEDCLRKLATDYPRETAWTIAFHGRAIGQVKSRIPAEIESYSRTGQQQIVSTTPKNRIPTVGQRTEEFGGFNEQPVYRPLVAISQPNFKDPDFWKPAAPDAAKIAIVRTEFRKKYPKITDCEMEELHDYEDIDIKIADAYVSKTGWRLIATSIKGCDIEDLRGDGLSLEWFILDPAGTAHYLHGNMRLVDAGDYDNSGHSQLLFFIDDNNLGGYRLYFDNFQKETVFEYHFH